MELRLKRIAHNLLSEDQTTPRDINLIINIVVRKNKCFQETKFYMIFFTRPTNLIINIMIGQKTRFPPSAPLPPSPSSMRIPHPLWIISCKCFTETIKCKLKYFLRCFKKNIVNASVSRRPVLMTFVMAPCLARR